MTEEKKKPSDYLWFVRTSGRVNVLFSVMTMAACLIGGWLLTTTKESDWKPVGQSLLAAGAVAGIAVFAAVTHNIFITRPYEQIILLGIRRFRQRGNPGSRWPKQLSAVKSQLILFGKDHSSLLRHNRPIIRRLIAEEKVTVTFYLLARNDPYYADARPDEVKEREQAVLDLFDLHDELAKVSNATARQLLLYEYDSVPTFSCSFLDSTIIFGPYVHGLDNPDVPEFEIEPSQETWLYDACEAAFRAAVPDAKVRQLTPPPGRKPLTTPPPPQVTPAPASASAAPPASPPFATSEKEKKS